MKKNIDELIIETIVTCINNYMDDLVKNTSLCEKRTAQIKQVLENNKYVLNIDGEEYIVKSNNSYKVNDTVTILKRYKQMKDIYILP